MQALQSRARNIRSVIFDGGYIDKLFLLDADRTLIHQIQAFLPPNIHVNGIPYDITTRPEAYLNSYIDLSHLFDQYGLRSFNAVPLSTSNVPLYLIIDTLILLQQLFGITQRVEINTQSLGIGRGCSILRARHSKEREGTTRSHLLG